MNRKKILFPVMLFSAILLTCIGLVSASKTLANPNKDKSFSVYMDYIDTDHITLLDNGTTNVSYLINLDESVKTYTISFDMINNGDFDAKYINTTVNELPSELKDIMTIDITKNTDLKVGAMDNVTVKYTLKDELGESDKKNIKKYKDLKTNLIMNYNQA